MSENFKSLILRANMEEKLVFYSLAYSYVIYFLGAYYVVGSLIGWAILFVYLLRLYVQGTDGEQGRAIARIAPIVWLWVLGMLVMELALLTAHIDRQLGFGATIKSTIGWAKGWALLALFPLIGCMIPIRPAILIRGVCIAAFSSVPFGMFGLLIYIAGLSGELYFSPFKAIGGPSEVFAVSFFGINPETHLPRWQFVGPWAPAAGLLACFYLIIAWHETDTRWRMLGIFGAFFMCMLCQSRAGWAIFFAIIPIMYGLGRLKYPSTWMLFGVMLPVLVLLGEPIYMWMLDSYQQVKDARPGSTRVRGTLARLAVQRWYSEAPIWGHGVVERGPKIVEHMPIGTHHSWYGLLFVKGIVGLFALAVPLTFTAIMMIFLAQKSKIARAGAAICVIIISYSFFENLEILAYIYWPALIWLGYCFNPKYEPKSM